MDKKEEIICIFTREELEVICSQLNIRKPSSLENIKLWIEDIIKELIPKIENYLK